MEINKSSWHYKAYAWSYVWDFIPVPQDTNLCSYVRTILFRVPVSAFLFSFLFSLLGAIILIGNIFAIPFGYYFRHPMTMTGNHEPTGQYQGLALGNFRLLPWHVLVPVLLVLLGRWNYRFISHHAFHGLGMAFFIMEIAMLLVGLIVGGTILYRYTGTGSLIQEYMDAKTQGICPLITFKDQ